MKQNSVMGTKNDIIYMNNFVYRNIADEHQKTGAVKQQRVGVFKNGVDFIFVDSIDKNCYYYTY